MANVHSWGPVWWRLTSFSNKGKMVIECSFWTRTPTWCMVAPRKRYQSPPGNHSSSVKSVLNVRVSLIPRGLSTLTSENKVHFSSLRLWIQPMQKLLLLDSQLWDTVCVYSVCDFRSLAISPLKKILLLRSWMKKIWFSLCPENSELWFQVTFAFPFPVSMNFNSFSQNWAPGTYYFRRITFYFMSSSLSSTSVSAWVQFPEKLSAVETGRSPSLWKMLPNVSVERSQRVKRLRPLVKSLWWHPISMCPSGTRRNRVSLQCPQRVPTWSSSQPAILDSSADSFSETEFEPVMDRH